MSQYKLFETEPNHSYVEIFHEWIAQKNSSVEPLRSSSIVTYAAMWNSVTRYFLERNKDPRRLDVFDLQNMLTHLRSNTVYGKRVLSLIEKVMHGTTTAKAARYLLNHERFRYADTQSDGRPPVTLNQIQQHELIKLLAKKVQEGSWRRQRDAAMAASMLGAGIKPGEALQLKMHQIKFSDVDSVNGAHPYNFILTGTALSSPRESPIAPWSALVLESWIQVRRSLNILGDLVFPADLSGVHPISKSTFYRQFQAMLEEAGIHSSKGGGHILRHTFAIRQLDQEKTVTQVKDWLGLQRIETMVRYKTLHSKTRSV